MEKEYFISIYLDGRRPKSNGKYPIKLRVFTPHPRKQKLYNTKFEFTEKEFESIWKASKPRLEYKDIRNEIREIETRAENVAKTISPFSLVQFEKKYLRNNNDGTNIIYHYHQAISKLESNDSFSTASNYKLSLKSIIGYIRYNKGVVPKTIPFTDITPDFLNNYERYMLSTLKRSQTTVSMYLRALRTLFNSAITEKEIDGDIYPFGKKKYQPPTVSSVKKALSLQELEKLLSAKPKTAEQIKAKDFWFFSFTCNGMNIKDIALLKYEHLHTDKIIFYRAKTINTSKTDLKPITVYLNDFSKSIIKKYGNKNTSKSNFIFPILSDNESEIEKHKKIKNFTKFINQNLKKLAITVGITNDISTYWARHSFSTSLIRKGATTEFVSEALGHRDLKTTQGYFAGFEDETKKEFMQTIMDFKPTKKNKK
jgi:integrase/recombinase XerD